MEKSTQPEYPNLESPPPETDAIDDIDEKTFHNEIKKIKPGRLSVVCIQAANLRRKDKNESKTLLSYNVRLILGTNSKTTLVKSSKAHQSVSQSPSFDNEVIHFDIDNPQDIVCTNGKDIKMKIEVLDQTPLQPFTMGAMTISAMRFLQGPTTKEWIPLLQNDDKSSNSSIFLQFMYTPVRDGMLVLTLSESRNLVMQKTKTIPSTTQLVFTIGEKMIRQSSITQDKFGNPTYSSEQIYLHLDKQNWFDALFIQIFHVTSTQNTCFGENIMNLLPLMNNYSEVSNINLPLNNNEVHDTVAGELSFQAQFLHSSVLNMKVVRAKSLKQIDTSQHRLNPFIICKSEGRSSYPQYRSQTIHGGGDTPTWEEDFSFSIVDHSKLYIECYNNDLVTNAHELIGSGSLSLLPVYRTGQLSTWINLTKSNEVGAVLPCGQVNITLNFKDAGSTFPLMHESNAKIAFKNGISQRFNSSSSPLGQEVLQEMRKNDDHSEEFSDEDIRSTFTFLDLDKNGYVGANELRHVLINMGELITDEEVDTMISMLDGQGDGQIGFRQFAAMARSSELEDTVLVRHQRDGTGGVKTSLTTSAHNMGVEAKIRKMYNFVENNKIMKRHVSDAGDFFLRKHRAFISDKQRDITCDEYTSVWELDYPSFCSLLPLPIQDTGESREVFHIFDIQKSGKIDLRLFILSLTNFISLYSTEERCSLMFTLFDGSQTGYIKPEDLETILAGTHLKSQKDVTRKVQTVLKFVDKEGSNKISRRSLLQAAEKFPNLLLPKFIK